MYDFDNDFPPDICRIIKKVNKVCASCGKKHELLVIFMKESRLMGEEERVVTYDAIHYYCKDTDIFYDDDVMRVTNQTSRNKAKELLDKKLNRMKG